MSIYGYADDCDLTDSLGERIGLKRLEDIVPDEDYVLHASYWWKVVRADWGTVVLYLEIAGPGSAENPETAVLVRDEGDLVVTAPTSSGLQFRDGVLLDVPWPGCDLVYVQDARTGGAGPGERVSGIFSLRYGSDGESYYAPADPETHPGVSSSSLLFPGRDLILAWEPVDVADLLERLENRDG
nr:MAG TPA: hypothetical protein [Caudoviricetes sp.]